MKEKGDNETHHNFSSLRSGGAGRDNLDYEGKNPAHNPNQRMKNSLSRGFTLIELLIVIAVIGILAGLLLPVDWHPRRTSKTTQTRMEINGLIAAIDVYMQTYKRFPASTEAADSLTTNCPDFTFGTYNLAQKTPGWLLDKKGNRLPSIANAGNNGYQNSNAEIMGILLDLTNYANGFQTVNVNHAKNPQRMVFLNPKFSGDTISPGVGTDGVYRDPWGSPYIITLDMNYDNQCRDAFYSLQSVSQQKLGVSDGWNGLANRIDAGGNGDHYDAKTTVMVWSLGPDFHADKTVPAPQGLNKDNVLSWK
jgi:prepilin-type N-terminal cleavage/methylation domain-containing protein